MKNIERKRPLSHDIKIFEMVEAHFRQDVHDFWNRANFYLLAQTSLFSVFIAIYPTLSRYPAIVAISIPLLGLVVAIFWFIVLRGSIKWIQLWREQVMKLDKELDRFQCYNEVERFAIQKPFLSPSYVTQFLPVIFVIIWSGMITLLIFINC
jgi:hypothetical protein